MQKIKQILLKSLHLYQGLHKKSNLIVRAIRKTKYKLWVQIKRLNLNETVLVVGVFTYRNVGIFVKSVSKTVTSPFSGAWFASISCLIADILILNSLWISVFPLTPFRSMLREKKDDINKFNFCTRLKDVFLFTYRATITLNFDTTLIRFRLT